jgi:hypothetical protein
MNQADFEMEFDKSVMRSKKTLINKAKEYASNNPDRLNQFYRAGEIQCIPPTEALVGMMTKHFTSICDMVKTPENYNLKQWNEKIGDLRNYTFLLDALLRDMEIE